MSAHLNFICEQCDNPCFLRVEFIQGVDEIAPPEVCPYDSNEEPEWTLIDKSSPAPRAKLPRGYLRSKN